MPHVRMSLKDVNEMPAATNLTFVFATCIYATFAVIGYLTFGVDIDRRGGLKRVRAPRHTDAVFDVPTTIELAPPENQEGGWRRVR